jgi:hypothetical protein
MAQTGIEVKEFVYARLCCLTLHDASTQYPSMTIRLVSIATVACLLSALLQAGAGESAADKVQLKPPCHGLMTSGWGQLPSEKLAFIDSVAINVEWRQLETKDQAFDGPAWDKIEAARKRGFRSRVRVLCGIYYLAGGEHLGCR